MKIGPTNGVLWQIGTPWSPSSPSIWGGRLYLTTFADHRLQIRCFNRLHGEQVWINEIKTDKLETFHGTEGSPAAATPASDGRRVVSYFGSFGLVCYDLQGGELWRHPPWPLALSGGKLWFGHLADHGWRLVLVNRDPG